MKLIKNIFSDFLGRPLGRLKGRLKQYLLPLSPETRKIPLWAWFFILTILALVLSHYIVYRPYRILTYLQGIFLLAVVLAAGRWGIQVILIPLALFIWLQRLFYQFTIPFLERASLVELGIYASAFIYFIKRRGEIFKKVPYKIICLVIYAFFAVIALLSGIAPDSLIYFQGLRWCVLAPIIAYIIIWGFKRNPAQIEAIVLSFLLGTIILSAISILAYRGYFPLVELEFEEAVASGRLAALYRLPLLGGMYLGGNLTVIFSSFSMPLALSLYQHCRVRGVKFFIALATLIANFIVIVISGSRSAWLGTLAACLLVTFAARDIFLKNFLRRTVIIVMIFIILTLLQRAAYVTPEISYRMSSLIEAFQGKVGLYQYWERAGGTRYLIWGEVWPLILKHPLGTGFMESFWPIGGKDLGPHSQYIFLLMGTGLGGLAAFLWFLISCQRKCLGSRKLKNYPYRWIAIGTSGVIVAYLFDAFMIHTFLAMGADIALFIICGAGVIAAEASLQSDR